MNVYVVAHHRYELRGVAVALKVTIPHGPVGAAEAHPAHCDVVASLQDVDLASELGRHSRAGTEDHTVLQLPPSSKTTCPSVSVWTLPAGTRLGPASRSRPASALLWMERLYFLSVSGAIGRCLPVTHQGFGGNVRSRVVFSSAEFTGIGLQPR